MKGDYYIYHHLDPRTNLPVYVGKGKGDRAWDLCLRHVEHKKWIKELKDLGLKPTILVGNHFESEKEAYQVERDDIAVLRALNCKLFNISPGGVGNLGELAKLFCTKPIICLNSGKHYNSTVDASEELKILAKRINDVLKGRKKSYRGYVFKYVDEKLNEIPEKIRKEKEFNRRIGVQSIPIICNETGKRYNSSMEASKEFGVSSGYIRSQVRGKIKHVRGFTFKEIK
jgi:hypothetical protein